MPENTSTGTLSAVGSTAVGVAVAKATESARSDALFHDPLAAEFVRAAGDAQAVWSSPDSDVLRRVMGDYLALRTRFFDDLLLTATRENCSQVVVLAAGLDTRALRLDWPPGTRAFEVDLPDVLAFKETVIAGAGATPTCDRRLVAADLRERWVRPLRDSGFDPDRPTAWLVEGLIVYLTAAEADALFADVGRLSAAGSRLGLEHVTKPMLEGEQTRAMVSTAGDAALNTLSSLWQNDNDATPESWLAGHGWTARLQDLPELAARHGRGMPLAFDERLPGTARAVLLEARRAGDLP